MAPNRDYNRTLVHIVTEARRRAMAFNRDYNRTAGAAVPHTAAAKTG